MSDDIAQSISGKLRQQKRERYQAIVQKEINTNYTDAESRAIVVKQMVLLVESHLPPSVLDDLHFFHLQHKKYNQPEEELVA